MKITKELLRRWGLLEYNTRWCDNYKETDGLKLVKVLIEDNQLSWANWLISHLMNYEQRVSYAVFAAEQVIDLYEEKYPNDKRPREAIEAAKKCIENPSKENKDAAYAAAYLARLSDALVDSSYEAVYAVSAASYAAYTSEDEEDSAEYASYAADEASVDSEMKVKILNYGIELLEVK